MTDVKRQLRTPPTRATATPSAQAAAPAAKKAPVRKAGAAPAEAAPAAGKPKVAAKKDAAAKKAPAKTGAKGKTKAVAPVASDAPKFVNPKTLRNSKSNKVRKLMSKSVNQPKTDEEKKVAAKNKAEKLAALKKRFLGLLAKKNPKFYTADVLKRMQVRVHPDSEDDKSELWEHLVGALSNNTIKRYFAQCLRKHEIANPDLRHVIDVKTKEWAIDYRVGNDNKPLEDEKGM